MKSECGCVERTLSDGNSVMEHYCKEHQEDYEVRFSKEV